MDNYNISDYQYEYYILPQIVIFSLKKLELTSDKGIIFSRWVSLQPTVYFYLNVLIVCIRKHELLKIRVKSLRCHTERKLKLF